MEIHETAERKKTRKHQNGLAWEEGAEKRGKVGEVRQELLVHFLRGWRNERAADPVVGIRESGQMCLDVNSAYTDNA